MRISLVLITLLTLGGIFLASPVQSQGRATVSDIEWKLTHRPGHFGSSGCIIKRPGSGERPASGPRPGGSVRSKSWTPQRDGTFALVLVNRAKQPRALSTSLVAPKLRVYQIKRSGAKKTEKVLKVLEGKAANVRPGKIAKPGAELARFDYLWAEELTLPDGEYRVEVVGHSPKVEVKIKLLRAYPYNPKDAQNYRPVERRGG